MNIAWQQLVFHLAQGLCAFSIRAIHRWTTIIFITFLFSLGDFAVCCAIDSIPKFVPIYRVQANERSAGLSLRPPDAVSTESLSNRIVFYAIAQTDWPAGLVPLFEVEHHGRTELRRRPLQGQEAFTDPIFFVAPLTNDPALNIAGRWTCVSDSPQRSKNRFAFDLTTDGNRLVGRFDPNTEYRFASILSGEIHSNRIVLSIKYIQDEYRIEGVVTGDRLQGKWTQADAENHGSWEGRRDVAPVIDSSFLFVPLFEWSKEGNGTRMYDVGGNSPGPGWVRGKVPLGRVWKRGQ